MTVQTKLARKKFLAIAAVALASLACGRVQAAPYPSSTIKVVVPFTAGSPVDAAARLVIAPLQDRLGQPVIVENRPGAGTTTGTKAVMNARPDGYTLLFTGSNLAYIPALYPKLKLDPVRGLAPVATAVTWSHVLVVSPGVPAKTMAELIAYAKANPGKLVFGYGLGTTPQILGAALTQTTGIDLTLIPYRGGDQARTDLLGGRVHINMAPVGSLLPLIREGKVRPLAFTGSKRAPDLPDVPTMAESGLPQVGFDPDAWQGFLAPAGTPAEIVDKLNRVINETINAPELKAKLATFGFDAKTMSPREFAAFLVREMQQWPPRLQAAGIQPE